MGYRIVYAQLWTTRRLLGLSRGLGMVGNNIPETTHTLEKCHQLKIRQSKTEGLFVFSLYTFFINSFVLSSIHLTIIKSIASIYKLANKS